MDYVIRRNPADLDSTGYMEIGPGRYSGAHWQDGFLFVWEDAFGMAEGILTKHFPDYDHFGMNEIPRDVGLKVVDDWQQAADNLSGARRSAVVEILNLAASYRSGLEKEIVEHRDSIRAMLQELSMECRAFYRGAEWICVLGV